jgi:phage terminase large subunit-like protein
LSKGYVDSLESRFGDSAFGRQELRAEILEAPEGALWSTKLLDDTRVEGVPVTIARVVVAVDPTRSDDPVDECGIVVVGMGTDGQAYVLFDKSVYGSPLTWIKAAVSAYRMHQAEKIVYEQNRLGATVEDSLRAFDREVRWEGVTATEGKHARAAPVASLYESAKVHHVGNFRELEDEMVLFDPKDRNRPSPNRLDALVWGVTYLMLGEHQKAPLIAR